jgi:hypothetical protein
MSPAGTDWSGRRLVDLVPLLQFTALFSAAFWAILFVFPMRAAHYDQQGRLVVRRIFLGNLLAGMLVRRVRQNGSSLVVEMEGQPAIVGGSVVAASLVALLVVPWLG